MSYRTESTIARLSGLFLALAGLATVALIDRREPMVAGAVVCVVGLLMLVFQ